MPELPDITIYLERLRPRIQGQILERAQIVSPFLLRTVDPSPTDLEGRKIVDLLRLGKRIVWCFADDLYLVLHLMIAGRLHWKPPQGRRFPAKISLAAFRFPSGTAGHSTESWLRRSERPCTCCAVVKPCGSTIRVVWKSPPLTEKRSPLRSQARITL